MTREMLGGKIHSATITQADLNYEGSCAIDLDLLEAANILPNERIHIYNVNSGARLDTYAIPAKRKSGIIGLNGAAARLGQVGDKVIICTYIQMEDSRVHGHVPQVVLVDDKNRLKKILKQKHGLKK